MELSSANQSPLPDTFPEHGHDDDRNAEYGAKAESTAPEQGPVIQCPEGGSAYRPRANALGNRINQDGPAL